MDDVVTRPLTEKDIRQRIRSGDKLLDHARACEMLSVSRSHFYHLVNTGELEAIRSGKRLGLRVWESSVCKYLAARQVCDE